MKKYIDHESIMHDKRAEYNRRCKCGHTMIVPPVGPNDYLVCSWCGKRIYRDIERQKEYDNKCAKEEFKFKFSQMFKNSEI